MASIPKKEDERRRSGLGARDASGETTRADPAGRMTETPGGTFGNEPEGGVPRSRPRAPRAERARRRTRRDNPRTRQ